MDRSNTTHRLTSTVALVALVTFALVATVGVSAATTASHADTVSTSGHSLGAAPADVEESDETLNITRVYDRNPDDPGSVTVDVIVQNPQILGKSSLNEITFNLSQVEYTNVEGFEHVEGDTYRLKRYAYNARITLENPTTAASEAQTDSYAQVVPENVRDCEWTTGGSDGYNNVPGNVGGDSSHRAENCDEEQGIIVEADTDGSTTLDTSNHYEVAGQGFVTSGNSHRVSLVDEQNVDDLDVHYYPLVVMGSYDTYSATEDGREVTLIVPDGISLRESPEDVVDSVAKAAAEMEAGNFDGPRYLIARSSEASAKGETKPTGARWTLVNADQPVHTSQNTWVHEYVHTTDDMRTDRSESAEGVLWFHEAYASHRDLKTSLRTGYGSYGDYRAVLEHGQEDVDTREFLHDKYHTGPLFIEALDRRMRAASNGENDTVDLVQRLRTYDGRATEDDIIRIIGELSDESVENFAERTVGDESNSDPIAFETGDTPSVPTQAEYENEYEAVPNVSTTVTDVEVLSERGNRTVHTQGPMAVYPGDTVRFTAEITNDGSAAGEYEVRFRRASPSPFSDEPTVYDNVSGELQGGETTTVTFTKTVGSMGTEDVQISKIVPNGAVAPAIHSDTGRHWVNVVPVTIYAGVDPENVTVVRENGSTDAVDHGAIVDADTEAVFFLANRSITWEQRANDSFHNVYVKDSAYETSTSGWALAEDLDVSPGERVEVRFWSEDDGDVQYLSGLEAVEGGAVPTDPDGDGLYEDVDGDGDVDSDDVNLFFENRHSSSISDYLKAYDFSGNGDIDHADVVALNQEAN